MNPTDETLIHSADTPLDRLLHPPPRPINRRRSQNERRPRPRRDTPFLVQPQPVLLGLRSHGSRLIHESRGSIDSCRRKINDASRTVSQFLHQSMRALRRNRMQDQRAPRNLEPFGLTVSRRHRRAASQKAPSHPFPCVAAAQNQNVQSITTSPAAPVRASALRSPASLE
jgi:hypothetical protein